MTVLSAAVGLASADLPLADPQTGNSSKKPWVTSARRVEVLPNLPVVADFVPGYEASAWYGIVAPKGTPRDIVERLNSAVNAILADPAAKSRLTELGAALLPGSPDNFGKFVADETDKWGKVIKFAGIKAE